MKLRNIIKKSPKKELKIKKNFNTRKKFTSPPNRAEEKTNKRKNKFIIRLSYISVIIFAAAVILLLAAYVFNYFIFQRLGSPDIITPGTSNTIQTESASSMLREKNIQIGALGYASSSGVFRLQTNNTLVYFSESIDFEIQVDLLRKIIDNLKLENKEAKLIDFRYNKPIVKF